SATIGTRPNKNMSSDLPQIKKKWAEGAREALLRPHIEPYADTHNKGWRAERDYLWKVINEYHARISWRLLDHEEPELPLPDYDPLRPAPLEELTHQERAERKARMVQLNTRIRRWLKYRARSLCRKLSTKVDVSNPFSVLLAQLAGVKALPKARQAYQQYMHESYTTVIAPVVEARWAALSTDKSGAANPQKRPNAPFRAKIAAELFRALPVKEQKALGQRAVDNAKALKSAYEAAMKAGASKKPEDRQKCIDAFGPFMVPLMKGLAEYTGLQGMIIMGGPIPKYNGEIGTIHLSVGRNLGAVPVAFPTWDKDRFTRDVVDFMKEYLGTAYTAEQCSEAALPPPASLEDAPYSFAKEDDDEESDSDSGSSSDSDSSSSSDSDSDSDSEEGAGKGKKVQKSGEKRKRGKEKENVEEVPVKKTKTLSKQRALALARADTGGGNPTVGTATATSGCPDPTVATGGATSTCHTVRPPTTHPTTTAMVTRPPCPPTTRPAMGMMATRAAGTAMATRAARTAMATRAARTAMATGAVTTAMATRPPTRDVPLMQNNPACPEDAPAWFSNAFAQISREDVGPEYRSLLEAYIALEQGYGFESEGRLSPRGRPAQVSEWIRDGRGRNKSVLAIPKMEVFEAKWWDWWAGMQPAWRRRDATGKPVRSEEYGQDWGGLVAPGPNGLLSVVAALYWWACARKSEGWYAAVADTLWVLEGLNAASE
ncbi:hypothetical protein B0H11DRAFT_1738353, partial [Mycena galericulata]